MSTKCDRRCELTTRRWRRRRQHLLQSDIKVCFVGCRLTVYIWCVKCVGRNAYLEIHKNSTLAANFLKLSGLLPTTVGYKKRKKHQNRTTHFGETNKNWPPTQYRLSLRVTAYSDTHSIRILPRTIRRYANKQFTETLENKIIKNYVHVLKTRNWSVQYR